MFKDNRIRIRGQGKPIKCYNCNGIGHIARNCTQPKCLQNSDYFKDKMLLMQAQENGVVLDEEELLFFVGEQPNTFDADVDNQPVRDLAHNKDNIFQADECDAFNSDVDDEPTAQSIFMANLSSVEHEIHNEVQHSIVIDSNNADMGNSNVIPYEQYLTTNDVSVVPSCASSAPNIAYVVIDNNVHTPNEPLVTELAIYKEQVAIYEQRAQFELIEREQRMDDQMRILIQDRNRMEEKLKQELHSVKLQLNHSIKSQTDFEKTCKKRITPTGITEGERGFEKTKWCYLTEVILFFNLLKEHFNSVQKSLITEVRAMKEGFENMEAEVDQNAVEKKCGEIERKNLLITNENLIAECLSIDVFYTAYDYVLNVSRFSDMNDALTIAQKRIANLEYENLNLRNKIQNNDHDSMIKHFSRLEVEHFNLQLKYQNLKEHFGNKKPVTSSDAPSFNSLFVTGKLNEQIQSRGNTIHELKEKISHLTKKNSDADPIFDLKALVSQNKDLTTELNALHDLNERFRAENEKVKQHYKELYNLIKITRTKTTDQNNSLLTEIENLKTQLKGKMPCVTIDVKTPKVSAFEKYAIDVEPIHPRQRSNRNVHQGYLNSLKDTLDTLREIVEEARSELPSDSNLDYACVYTKRSQELLANASASCPKAVNKRDKFIATTHVTKKRRVTFADPLETSGNNTPKHVKQQSVQPTNVLILPSTGVNTATIASGSKPLGAIQEKISTCPVNNMCQEEVEDHPRNINHDKCVDKSLKFSKTTPVRKIWRVKQVKQPWKPTGKLFTTVGHHWKPTGRTFPLGAQCTLTRPTVLTSDVVLADPQARHAPVDYNIVCSNQLDPNIDWGSNVSNSPFLSVFKYSSYNSSFVIMADANINAPKVPVAVASPPTRFDEQILPRNNWVPVGKSNCFLDVERTQANPIFKIDDTIRFDKDKGYSCQLDEQLFYLTKATLRDALQLPQDNNNFTSPPNANTIISFVNELGYPNVILWGVVNKANIDYTERIWEEFTQCIHSFIEDKMNLALHTEGKKKVNPLVISGVRFTKLIIKHLQSIHKLHKRLGSPLHLPYEESALGYPKFSFKNTKRVRFRMAIPDTLISKDIRSAPYYSEYVAKVTKYQRYLAGEVVSDDEAPASKPAKGAKPKTPKKPKLQSPKTAPVAKPAASKTSKSTSSQPPKPRPAPAKPQEKKRKLVLDAAEALSQAKHSKADEGAPADEPRFGDEDADISKAVEESFKDAYVAPRGPLPPVVIREPEPGKYEPLSETPKKKNPAEQFIFQRCTPAPNVPSSHKESSSLYVELGLTDSETESDNEASHKGQA
ncbi:integrase, catalytic region, zinc finger, CCHC-type containing protein [Tanacetum coccineum]